MLRVSLVFYTIETVRLSLNSIWNKTPSPENNPSEYSTLNILISVKNVSLIQSKVLIVFIFDLIQDQIMDQIQNNC